MRCSHRASCGLIILNFQYKLVDSKNERTMLCWYDWVFLCGPGGWGGGGGELHFNSFFQNTM
jgi:hypothetical protein